MKPALMLGAPILLLSGCVVVPAEPVPVVHVPPPPAVVVRPAYRPHYHHRYHYGPYWRRWR